jgi:hypothetical protein
MSWQTYKLSAIVEIAFPFVSNSSYQSRIKLLQHENKLVYLFVFRRLYVIAQKEQFVL